MGAEGEFQEQEVCTCPHPYDCIFIRRGRGCSDAVGSRLALGVKVVTSYGNICLQMVLLMLTKMFLPLTQQQDGEVEGKEGSDHWEFLKICKYSLRN